jgi:uncharacterized protein (DUF4415 family)
MSYRQPGQGRYAHPEREQRWIVSGVPTDLTPVASIVDEAEAGYDVEMLKSRRRGRPMLGAAPAEVVPVRLDPDLKEAVEARAEADHTTTSEIIREALRRFLDVA